MDREKIIGIVTKYINQALEGQEVENPKVDFKREWYKLKSKHELRNF